MDEREGGPRTHGGAPRQRTLRADGCGGTALSYFLPSFHSFSSSLVASFLPSASVHGRQTPALLSFPLKCGFRLRRAFASQQHLEEPIGWSTTNQAHWYKRKYSSFPSFISFRILPSLIPFLLPLPPHIASPPPPCSPPATAVNPISRPRRRCDATDAVVAVNVSFKTQPEPGFMEVHSRRRGRLRPPATRRRG